MLNITVFSDLTPYSVVDTYQCFRGPFAPIFKEEEYSALKGSSETSVNVLDATRRHIAEGSNVFSQCRGSLNLTLIHLFIYCTHDVSWSSNRSHSITLITF
jgi:hypothetical protein